MNSPQSAEQFSPKGFYGKYCVPSYKIYKRDPVKIPTKVVTKPKRNFNKSKLNILKTKFLKETKKQRKCFNPIPHVIIKGNKDKKFQPISFELELCKGVDPEPVSENAQEKKSDAPVPKKFFRSRSADSNRVTSCTILQKGNDFELKFSPANKTPTTPKLPTRKRELTTPAGCVKRQKLDEQSGSSQHKTPLQLKSALQLKNLNTDKSIQPSIPVSDKFESNKQNQIGAAADILFDDSDNKENINPSELRSPVNSTKNDKKETKSYYSVLMNSRSRLSLKNSPKRQTIKFIDDSKTSDDKEQLIIDAGQKKIGAHQCTQCHMVYSLGEPQDEKMHSRFHEKYLSNLKFLGWKKEKLISSLPDGRIIMITKLDPAYMQKKVEEILDIVDSSLGYPENGLKRYTHCFLFVTVDKKVAGCLIAEAIKEACRALPQTVGGDLKTQPWCCSTEPVKAICGINRLWTNSNYRRQKIATRLLDSLRCNFIYGHILSKTEIAFSDPSPYGRKFAANYIGSEEFLVYK